LVEVYCLERNIPFTTYGSWTLQSPDRTRGAEPDECYVFGVPGFAAAVDERPHLAIEVVWTSGRIDKLDIYRKLGVSEVWYWRKGRIQPYCLRGERYESVEKSEVLPGLDLKLLTSFLEEPTTFDAIRRYRETVRGR
jgi:Uma2 family endonuclease